MGDPDPTAHATYWIDGTRYDFYGDELRWVLELARQADTQADAWAATKRFGERVRERERERGDGGG